MCFLSLRRGGRLRGNRFLAAFSGAEATSGAGSGAKPGCTPEVGIESGTELESGDVAVVSEFVGLFPALSIEPGLGSHTA